ncbi:aminotransferase class I/II-fold pyridoxal phosphate-dependent enzyme [Paenibacillus sp. 1P07SE]|uniref:aminotransferase class I/II-fold pyridoxal phosphate-dependent enzyme n=1 Tax=Paenibacillus sp. 1P07SE TaxID=3132209 RepID=UPI0039A67A59
MPSSNKGRAPLYEALRRHRDAGPHSFHVPGHGMGRAWEERQIASEYRELLPLDVTELSDTDDLHQAEGVIREAQQLAALTFGAEETCFLVGGSTSGNLALILAHCRPGDILIVQRNIHKSVVHGLQLAQACAVFLSPRMDGDTGLALIPALEDVEAALQQYPQAKAVLLSTPNYYGLGVSLAAYAQLVHSYGRPLLVDEAHGAHYGLHPELPRSALQDGADGVVQSTHKTLTAMTMGAMLHLQGNRIERSSIRQMLQTLQSSSPSYPIMASLDIARAMIDSDGTTLFDAGLAHARIFRERLALETDFESVGYSRKGERQVPADYDYYDPLRAAIRDRKGRVSGYELHKMLEERGCWAEMADPVYVVLIFGIGTTAQDVEALLQALQQIHEKLEQTVKISPPPSGVLAAALHQASDSPLGGFSEPIPFGLHLDGDQLIETIPLSEAEGRIAAEMITPYPPGIPLLYAGERISGDTAVRLGQLAALGAKCQGAADPSLSTLRVRQIKTV